MIRTNISHNQTLLAAGLLTLVVFVAACAAGQPILASLSALVLAATAITVAYALKKQAVLDRANGAVADLSRLSGVLAGVYAWGGATMALTYLFSGLRWQHGWQYALAMLLIAAAIAGVARYIESQPEGAFKHRLEKIAVRAALAHTVAASIAIFWLIASGKIATVKDDWAANIIFMAGGAAAATASLLLARAYEETRA